MLADAILYRRKSTCALEFSDVLFVLERRIEDEVVGVDVETPLDVAVQSHVIV